MKIYRIAKSKIPDPIYINLPSSRQQTDYSCGAVALRSIAKYYGKDLEKDFRDLCDSGKTKGTHPEDIMEGDPSFLNGEIKVKSATLMNIEELPQ